MGYREGTWTPTKRRGPIAAEFSGPGPAAVTLPSLFGTSQRDPSKAKAPAYTFRPRINEKLELPGPGPAKYLTSGVTRKGRESPVAPTISGRMKEDKLFNTPAPNAYHSEKGDDVVHDKAPLFSFGVKIKDQKLADVPASNIYQLEKGYKLMSNKAPSWTLAMKLGVKPNQNPSPNAYSIDNRFGGPMYSFGVRPKSSKQTPTPAPNDYQPNKGLNVIRKRAPSCVLGMKHHFNIDRNPAPNAYNANNKMTGAMFSFGIRPKTSLPVATPAVNKFYDAKWRPLSAGTSTTSKHMMLKEGHTQDCPCYDRWLKHKETRERVMKERGAMPGPGAYTIKDDLQKVRTPCWNCVGRKDPKLFLKGPAPNAYNVSGLVHKGGTPHTLAAHMFGKAKDFTKRRVSDTPAPNHYKIPTPFDALHSKWQKERELKRQVNKNCLYCPMKSKSRNAIKSEADVVDKESNSGSYRLYWGSDTFRGKYYMDN